MPGAPALYITYADGTVYPAADDLQLARMGFHAAQEALGYGQGPIPGTRKLAVCGWHGRKLDPEIQGASVAIVQKGGPLEDMLGARVLVSTAKHSVIAYVHNMLDLNTGEDISLSRRLFAELGLLSAEELRVTVDVLGTG